MIKTSRQITIEKDIFANDLLKRKNAITDLSKLIENQKEPLVLSINADWGAGKTTFVQLWQAYLKTQEIDSIYFNAWENDFSNEPLVAILGELNIYIETSSKENVKQEFKKTKEIALKILPTVIGVVAGSVAEKATSTLIDQYKNKKTDLNKLKESIAKVLNTINSDKPFVIFIDELDRCKPLYAIELLERIKHIFDIERLIFVLSIDKDNLAKSIKSQYGDIDTNNYLRRFIHLEYPLKNPNVDEFCAVLFERFDLAGILNLKDVEHDYHYDLDLIPKLSSRFNLSLRQIEQIFTKLYIFFKTIPPGFYQSYPIVFILFECLKSYNKQLYDDLLTGTGTAQKTIEDIVLNINFRYRKEYIKAIIVMTPMRNNDREKQESFIEGHPDRGLIEFLQYRKNYNFTDDINTVIKHIDFEEKFDFSTSEQN